MRKWLWLLIFGETGRVLALEAENSRLSAEIEELHTQLHAFYDAILIESGRNPIWAGKEVTNSLPADEKPDTTPLDDIKSLEIQLRQEKNPRRWASIASALQKKADSLAEQGLYVAGSR